jgi:hypothetical protein
MDKMLPTMEEIRLAIEEMTSVFNEQDLRRCEGVN